jgi:hypothetical protein
MSNLVKKQSAELAIYTKEQFIKEFAPRTCMVKMHSINSIEKAVKSDLNSLASLTKAFDREFIINYLQFWIIDLNEFLNLTNRMSQEQIKDTAELLYLDNYNLNIADINIIFTNAKKGAYGQMFGSLDGMKILSWFQDYNFKRMDIIYDNHIQDTDRIKYQEEKNQQVNPLNKKLFGNVVTRMNKK